MAIDAPKKRKHSAVEVPTCTTLQECWDVVDTSDATRKHCLITEHCCYGETEMVVLYRVRDGLFVTMTPSILALTAASIQFRAPRLRLPIIPREFLSMARRKTSGRTSIRFARNTRTRSGRAPENSRGKWVATAEWITS